MAKTYQVSAIVKFVNRLMRALVGFSIGPKQMYILTAHAALLPQAERMQMEAQFKSAFAQLRNQFGL